jgi:hypothetical protein
MPKTTTFRLRHDRVYLSPDLFLRVVDRIQPMRPRLDALMFEFEYLNKSKTPSLETFLEKLAAFLASLRRETGSPLIAIETRNRNYLTDAYFRFL